MRSASFTVNGAARSVEVEPRELLVYVLRERLGLTGTNVGCAQAFSRWITSAPTQRLIGGFGKSQYGQALFHPDAGAQ